MRRLHGKLAPYSHISEKAILVPSQPFRLEMLSPTQNIPIRYPRMFIDALDLKKPPWGLALLHQKLVSVTCCSSNIHAMCSAIPIGSAIAADSIAVTLTLSLGILTLVQRIIISRAWSRLVGNTHASDYHGYLEQYIVG